MGEYSFVPQYLYGDKHKYINQIFAGAKDFELSPELRKFASIFLKHYPMREITQEQAEHLASYIKNAISFFREYQPNKTAIRVYNPDFYSSDHLETIIEIHSADAPFLLDSILAEIKRLGVGIYKVIHPVFATQRDEHGGLQEFDCGYDNSFIDPSRESFIHIHIEHQREEADLKHIKQSLTIILQYVYLAVADWKKMTSRLYQCKDISELNKEGGDQKEFLDQVESGYFVFLGALTFNFDPTNKEVEFIAGSELGIAKFNRNLFLENIIPSISAERSLPKKSKLKLHVGKLNIVSPVHRDANIDYISVVAQNQIYVFIGLFTSILYYQSCTLIPIIREKVRYVLSKSNFSRSSFSGKAVISIIESLPRDELFAVDNDELFEIVMEVHALLDYPTTRLFSRVFGNSMSILLFVPSGRISAEVTEKINKKIADELGSIVTFLHVNIADSEMSYYHIILELNKPSLSGKEFKNLEKQLDDLTITWADTVRTYIAGHYGAGAGHKISDQFCNSFPKSYSVSFEDKDFIIKDIEQIKKLADGSTSFCLQEIAGDEDGSRRLYLKVYSRQKYGLSDLISMIQNFGFKVDYETIYEVSPAGMPSCFIHVFSVNSDELSGYKIGDCKDRLELALAKVFAGEAVDDLGNQLIMLTGLDYREVMLLRGISKYLYQLGAGYNNSFVGNILVKNHHITILIVKLFTQYFKPGLEERESHIKSIKSEINKRLMQVKDGLEDRILRLFVSTIRAMLRTNYFICDENGDSKSFISFKIECAKIPEMPEPRPLVEIFVYSPNFEAIHLRTGRIARGGIRWSDRGEDFRTEVLGLVKAQLPKNSVIVPVGSKGGFVLKRTEKLSADEKYKLGISSYKNFIRGMLDITDNIVEGKVIAPSEVVRYDGDDPYLVVAADKGTATFSDMANQVAAEYNFWLGDAFASGGSAGYDHKKMAITARGSWVAVKRHFAELLLDPGKDEFTVLGIGDMAGDVFGNGMLLSDQIKLVAAFNHLHIFIDPSPDKKKTFAERKRLFQLPRSNWVDFDQKALSKGAMIYERSSKILELTPEICELLGTKEKQMEPSQLIKMMLCLDVDLLWNGGIGTYVKASTESNYEVGDKSNDALRVDGNMLRAKVVAEGGNLGLTQKGRIEFALCGGLINTDFIDNSAGVDCSDHEVNIKIGLNKAVASGKIDIVERNKLLVEMTDDVASLVLRDNYLQTLALTIAQASSADNISNYDRFITMLEQEIKLNRKLEGLPSSEELYQRTLKAQGLTRPELAVVLAYGKIAIYNHLIESKVPDDDYFFVDLVRYFPEKMSSLYPEEISSHFLRREIVATSVANSIVNRIVPYYIHLTSEDTGIKFCDIVRAYAISRDVFSMRDLWEQISALDHKIDTEVQVSLFNEAMKFLMRNTSWLLRNTLISAKSISEYIADFKPGADLLMEGISSIISGPAKAEYHEKMRKYKELGVPSALASKISLLRAMSSIFNIVQIATSNNEDYKEVANIYFAVSERLNLEWLRIAIDKVIITNSWQRLSVKSYKEELYDKHRRIVSRVIKTYGVNATSINEWCSERGKILMRYDGFLAEVQQQESFDLAMINLIFRRMDALLIKDLS